MISHLKLLALLLSVKGMMVPSFKKEGFQAHQREYRKEKLNRLPGHLQEASGLVFTQGYLWTHTDSGGKAILYKISTEGVLVDSVELPIRQIDWEAVTADDQGNLYIGDFGNNGNMRQNLVIYKYHLETGDLHEIYFEYEDQQAFPPSEDLMNFDCEGFYWQGGSLHLFSKNRGEGKVKHYVLNDQEEKQVANIKEEIPLTTMITGADIAHDGRIALLTYGKVFLFESEADGFVGTPYKRIRFVHGQTESIAFLENGDLVVGNELGKLFLLRRRK